MPLRYVPKLTEMRKNHLSLHEPGNWNRDPLRYESMTDQVPDSTDRQVSSCTPYKVLQPLYAECGGPGTIGCVHTVQ